MSDSEDEMSADLLQDFNTLIGGCQKISDEIEKSSETLRSLSGGLSGLEEQVPDGFGETLDEIHKTLKGTSKGTSKGGSSKSKKIGEMIKSVLK